MSQVRAPRGMRAVPVTTSLFLAQGFDAKYENFRIINAMLPRIYHPPLQNNIYERRAASVVQQVGVGGVHAWGDFQLPLPPPLFPMQLFGGTDMGIDYDQFLDKNPQQPKAVFAWHQDMAYWPPAYYTTDTRTATFSLALDATHERNGALRFIPGSHKVRVWVRPHRHVRVPNAPSPPPPRATARHPSLSLGGAEQDRAAACAHRYHPRGGPRRDQGGRVEGAH